MKHVYEVAESYIGLKEFPGAKHNPTIVGFAKTVGHEWVQDDETAWCATFVGAVLAQCGAAGTNALNARSYMKWGEAVDIQDAQPGDVVVLWRDDPKSWKGHVGVYAGKRLDQVKLLGGNQGNAVSVAEYPASRVLGVRRLKAARTSPAQSTTLQATVGTAVAGGTGAITAISALDGTAQIIVAVAAVLAGLGLAWIMRERLRKWARGIR